VPPPGKLILRCVLTTPNSKKAGHAPASVRFVQGGCQKSVYLSGPVCRFRVARASLAIVLAA
jgi:hypothetical protein